MVTNAEVTLEFESGFRITKMLEMSEALALLRAFYGRGMYVEQSNDNFFQVLDMRWIRRLTFRKVVVSA